MLTIVVIWVQPLGRVSFFPSGTELKKSDVKPDYEDLNSRLFKYKGASSLRPGQQEQVPNDHGASSTCQQYNVCILVSLPLHALETIVICCSKFTGTECSPNVQSLSGKQLCTQYSLH